MNFTTEQRDAVKEIDRNLCVIAGAGTGKTRVLVAHYIRLLEEDFSPEEIAAITFTEKAAAEMTSRVRESCDEHAAQSPSAAERRTWLQRRSMLAAGHIGTIHGFCSRLIRQYPVEAGVDPRFAVAEELQRHRMLTDAVSETLSRLLAEKDADLQAAARHYGLRRLREILSRAVASRDRAAHAAAALERPDEDVLDAWRSAAEEEQRAAVEQLLDDEAVASAADFLASVRGPEGDRKENARTAIIEGWTMLREAEGLEPRDEVVRALASIDLRGGSKKKWASQQLFNKVGCDLKTVRDACKKLVSKLETTDPASWPDELALARNVARVATAAVERFQENKQRAGVLDFDDLLIFARDLLAENDSVRKELGRRYRRILVDELQDTNALQVNVLNLLVGSGESGTFDPRPGTFFGVGDPKQSIYRFRGADVDVFRDVADSFGQTGRALLTRTFRFHDGLAALTNTVFGRLMGAQFAPLRAHRKEVPPASLEVLLATAEDGASAETRRSCEASRIATRIQELVADEGARYGDVAVLMHRQTQSYPYEDALRRLEIPFHVVGGRRFYQQQEVRDVATALRATRNPGDGFSLAALLRSPFFGLSDDALFHLCRAGPLPDVIASAAAAEGLSPDDREKLASARAWLSHFRARAGRVGVARLVEEIVFDGAGNQGGLAHVVLPQWLGQQRYANLRRLVEQAWQYQQHGEARLEEFLEAVERSTDEGVKQAEAPLAEENRDAVLLMTVHKAKGLEFPYVFLANADAGRRPGREVVHMDGQLGFVPRRPERPAGSNELAAFSLMKRRDEREQNEEFTRLFYVAVTRAQERVFICGSQPGKQSSDWKGSWLAQLGAGLDMDLSVEPARVRRIEPVPGAVVEINVASAQPVRFAGGGPRTPASMLCDHGALDREALGELMESVSADSVADLVARVKPVPQDREHLILPATALAEYDRCPALFYLRRVLGIGQLPKERRGDGPGGAVLGSVVHECLRRLEPASAGDPARMVHDVAQEFGVSGQEKDFLNEATGLVRSFVDSPLFQELASARTVYREAPFVLAEEGVTITGTIDLLFQGPKLEWTLLDFKTDRVVGRALEAHAKRYWAQMAVYARAAERILNTSVKKACLAYLRPGKLHYMKLAGMAEDLVAIVERLKAADFAPPEHCDRECPYRSLCQLLKSAGSNVTGG